MLIAWLTLYWGILPHVGEWRPQIEARVSAAVGLPVTIGAIHVRSGGWVPALELTDVVLHDARQHEALRLPRVAAAVSARSLLALQLRFEQLLIEGARLEVRRDAQDRVFVAGLEMTGGRPGQGSPAADWFFQQHEFVIRHGTLRWIDERRGTEPLELTDVDVVVRNRLHRHAMRLDATPPAAWGERLSLRGEFTQRRLLGRPGDWRRWNGTVFADLPRADVSQLGRHVDLPFELHDGDGALRVWADVEAGKVRRATADLGLREVSVRLPDTVAEPLTLTQVQGRLQGERDARGWRVSAQQFGFVTGEGLRWPRGNFSLAVREGDGDVLGGELSADRLDLGLMARIAAHLPLAPALRQTLQERAPEGLVNQLSARWDGPADAPARYGVQARVVGLSIASLPSQVAGGVGQPGWRNASIDLDASERGGHAKLSLDQGALLLPGVFEQPELPFDRFAARLEWRIDEAKTPGLPPALTLKAQDVAFANADAQAELTATWRTGPGPADVPSGTGHRFPGRLEMSGKLLGGRGTAVARYLPLGVPAATRHYVAEAVQAGEVKSATFKVRGDLWDFPFSDPRTGEFRIAGQVEGVKLAYVPASLEASPADSALPAWPAFEQVAGELVFDRASMAIRNASGKVYGAALQRVNGAIPDLEHPVLAIDGLVRGPAAELLRYVHASPLQAWSGGSFAQSTATGAAELKLDLRIPLDDVDRTQVKGSVVLAGNDVRLRPDVPLLAAARGRVDFTQDGVRLVNTAARVLGGDMNFDGGTQPDGALRFNGQGTVTAEALRRADELGGAARLASALSGQLAYRLSLGFVDGQVEATLSSPLTGLGIDLPAPLGKPAEQPMPLRLETRLQRGAGAGAPLRDTLRLDLGGVLQAQYLRDLSGPVPRVLSGGIGVRAPAPQPAAGVQAQVVLASLDVDAWQGAIERLGGSPAAPTGPAAPGGADGYRPTTLKLQVQELAASSRTLTRVAASVSEADDGTWRASVDAAEMNGDLEWRPPRGGGAAGRLYARLKRLSLPPSEAQTVETYLASSPNSVPALDIVVDDFELSGKRLGRVEVQAVNRGSGLARDWRLTKLEVAVPEARLAGTGQWTGGGRSRSRMVMDFQLDLSDSGAFAERLGLGRVLRGGKGRMNGQIAWDGSPLAFHVPSLDGRVHLALDAGQFLKVAPGMGRLLGVLSLQALPRRLTLDFRDLFGEGFAFDNVTGDVTIRNGEAQTNNLRMRGVQAAVLMEGRADIEDETQDLRVIVVPELNAGTASLAYAVINPALGLGSFVAQMFLRKPLMAASTREFHISGTWADPKVERVARALDAPLPDMDRPASAPLPSRPPENRP
ncbi:YhdP family protein [Aquincola sp. GCM10022187]